MTLEILRKYYGNTMELLGKYYGITKEIQLLKKYQGITKDYYDSNMETPTRTTSGASDN